MREGLVLVYDIYRCGVTGWARYGFGLDGQWWRWWPDGHWIKTTTGWHLQRTTNWTKTGVSGVPTRILWHAVLAVGWC